MQGISHLAEKSPFNKVVGIALMRDKRGILRGRCTVCYCTEYISEGQLKCKNCNHVPTKHEVLGQDDVNDLSDGSDNEVQWESVENLKSVGQVDEVKLGNTVTVVKAWESAVVYTDLEDSKFTQFLQQCQFPGCNDVANFDLNTREYTSVYCYDHLSTAQPDINSGQLQGGVTLIASVLPSATAVNTKVNNQIEILAIVNSQTTIFLCGQSQWKFQFRIVIPMQCSNKIFRSRLVKEF